MRVLAVTTWLPTPETPESGIFVERDITLLAADHDVHVVHLSASGPRPAGRQRPWSTQTVSMRPGRPRTIAAAAKVLSGLLPQFDLLHTMAPSALLPFRRLRVGPPWVHTEHWSGILSPQTLPLVARLALPMTMRLLARPDMVIAVGEQLAEAIGRTRAGPIAVVPNSVTLPSRLVERRPINRRLRLIGVGGLISRKGPLLAVEVVAELVRRGWDVDLSWVGSGPLKAEVESLAVRLGVDQRVTVRGSIEPEAVPEALADADLFILPTTGETFGVSIAEALAAGRPVIVGAEGGQSEFVHAPDGVLVTDRTPTAWADGVERLVELNASRSAADVARLVTSRFTDANRRSLYAEAYVEAVRQHDHRA